MKLNEVTSTYRKLAGFAGKKFPVKISYAISKNLKKLEKEMELIEKGRMEILEQFAEKTEDGQLKIEDDRYILGDKEQDFQKEYMEYLETETDVDLYKVPIAELDKMEDVRYSVLSPDEITNLMDILEDEEEVPEETA